MTLAIVATLCALSLSGIVLPSATFAQPPAPRPGASQPSPPSIASLLRPEVLRRAAEEREIMTSARLEELKPPGRRKYRIYAVMQVGASPKKAHRVLTDYEIYKKLIPFVEEAKFNPRTSELDIRGGIWGFKMVSRIRFIERSERWIDYTVVRGSFQGMRGRILFEPHGERGTLVMLEGVQEGKVVGPKLVLERGAEIVFGFTAKRMRSYLETEEEAPKHDGREEIPQPRRGL